MVSKHTKKLYIPDRGDIVLVDFLGNVGHEQGGRRPALVISKKIYNKSSGLVTVCPITSAIKNYPFEVRIESGKAFGVVLVDQARTIDWKVRRVSFLERLDQVSMIQASIKLSVLVGI